MRHTPSPQLITDAVVAEYIHEISVRRQAPEPEAERPREAASARKQLAPGDSASRHKR